MTDLYTLRWMLFGLVLVVAGCATAPDERDDETRASEQEQDTTISIGNDGTILHSVSNRTVALLWERAESARSEDRLEDAIGTLERALQISPENSVLWSRLAELQLEQNEYAAAENLALRSNSLAGDQPRLRYRNWLLIAEARDRRGDDAGAQEARAEADHYGGS